MKKIKSIFLLNSMWFSIFYICLNSISFSQDINLTDEEKEWIKDHPVIISAGSTGSPPLEFIVNGKSAGYSIDYLKLVGQKVGLTFEFVEGLHWEEYISLIKNREIDLMHDISINSQRKEYLNFTQPYLHLPMVYFGRKGSTPINSIEDLEGRRIGAISGWAPTVLYQSQFPHLNIIEQNDVLSALTSLSAGTVDVAIVQLPIGNYVIKHNFVSNIEVIGQTLFPQSLEEGYIRFGVRKDWPILATILQKASEAVTRTEKEEISSKWLNEYNLSTDIRLTNEELNWLSLNKTIRVAADSDASPIEFIDPNGNISGFSGDYLKLISKKLNINFEWIENTSLADGLDRVKKGEADVLAAVTPSPERNKYLNFSDSYLTVSSVIFSNKANTQFTTLEALAGHTLAQVNGFSITEILKTEHPQINIQILENMSDALKMVNDGKADAFVGSILSSSAIIASNGLIQLAVVGDTPYQSLISIATRKELPLLSSSIQKALNSITEVERDVISNKWAAFQVEEVQNYDLLWKFAGSAFVILTIILLWNYKLRHEISLRKQAEMNTEIALIEAQKANAAKSEFLANMSHELRTPLNAMIGFSEAMSQGIFGEIKQPRYKEYLKDISDSGHHLATVIDDILDLSKIEAEKWQLNETEFSLESCINSSLNMFKGISAEKDIDVSYIDNTGQNVIIMGDEHCIKRTLINLMSNAVKFTPPSGSVTCTVSINNDGLSVAIEDTGIGIPEDRLEHVLHPFAQVKDSQNLNEEGTGLGLSIVTQLIKLHQGEFTLESEMGIGTIATITLPTSRIVTKSYR